MNNLSFLSIIIPTYNSEATLQKCLDSIICQTFCDYEILIIDGASIDNTITIAKKYNDSRVKVYSEPDNGIYDAMNKGIKIAHGDWIYFLGSDDTFYDSNVLGNIFSYLKSKEYDIIYGNVFMPIYNSIYDGIFTLEKIQTKNICHQAIFYKKKVLINCRGFNIRYKSLADYDLNLKWFFNSGYNHKYINQIIANYSNKGFSSTHFDSNFYQDLPAKLIKLGLNKLSVKDLKENAWQAASNEYRNQKYIRFIFFRWLYYLFRFVNIIQRRVLLMKLK